jgi:hypothetical protein
MRKLTVILMLLVLVCSFAEVEADRLPKDAVRQLLENSNTFQEILNGNILVYGDDTFANLTDATIQAILNEPILEKDVSENGEELGGTEHFLFRKDTGQEALLIRNAVTTLGEPPVDTELASVFRPAIRGMTEYNLQYKVGLQNPGDIDIQVTRLMVGEVNNDGTPPVHEAIAYKAQVKRCIVRTDIPVDTGILDEQSMVFSYFMDGSLHKIYLQWPAIRNGTHVLSTMSNEDQIVDAVYGSLAGHPLAAIQAPLEAETGLMLRNGELKKAVFIKGLLSDGEGGGREGILEVDMAPDEEAEDETTDEEAEDENGD